MKKNYGTFPIMKKNYGTFPIYVAPRAISKRLQYALACCVGFAIAGFIMFATSLLDSL